MGKILVGIFHKSKLRLNLRWSIRGDSISNNSYRYLVVEAVSLVQQSILKTYTLVASVLYIAVYTS